MTKPKAKPNPKPKRVRRRVGDVVAIPLAAGRWGHAWVLDEPLVAVFDGETRRAEEPAESVVKRPIAFRIWVMNHAITRGRWPVVGHVQPPANLKAPWFFRQDAITDRLTKTTGGHEREVPITFEQATKLECAAVWEPEHVEERLGDHLAGRPNVWVEIMKPKRTKRS